MKMFKILALVLIQGIVVANLSAQGINWVQATSSAGWTSRFEHTSVAFNNKMWLLGGYDSNYRNDVWSSTNGINWTCATASAGWPGRYNHTSVVFDNKIWVMGGSGFGGSQRKDVWYSNNGTNWTCATSFANWDYREGHSSVVYDNKMWVMGGRVGDNKRNDVWYSTDGVNWTCATVAASWSAREGFTIIVFDNRMWVIGGWDANGIGKNDVWYSMNGVNWTCATNSAGWSGRCNHTSVVLDNKMWVIGGWNGNFNNEVWYSSDGVNWTCANVTSQWSTRYSHTSVVFDYKLWVFGGIENNFNYKNDVWYSNFIKVLSPNGNEIWPGSSNQIIKWRVNVDNINQYRLILSKGSGLTYPDTIAQYVAPSETTYTWSLPTIDCSSCRVAVQILNSYGVVRFQDASDANFTIRTLATVILPNGGESWLGGTNQIIKWRTTGTGFARYRILWSRDGGLIYSDTIAHNIASTESAYIWVTPVINSMACRVKIQILDSLSNIISEDASDGNFSIQTVIVVFPNGSEIWPGGTDQTIKWRIITNFSFARFRILLSKNGGTTYLDTIMHNVASTESTFMWLTPPINVTTCRVKVQVLDSLLSLICEDASNSNFTIRTLPTVMSPNGGETWLGGTDQMIKWRTTGAGFARYRILFSQNSGSSYLDTIVHNIPPTESMYLWATPLINNTTGRVNVQILDTLSNLISEDASNGNFTIQTVMVVSPNGGEVWSGGSDQIIKWRATGTGFARFRLLLSRNGGSTYTDTISHNVALTESTYLWLTPTINVTTCRIKVQVLDTSTNVLCEDASNGNFIIHTITLLSPNGGEVWQGGSSRIIKWRTTIGLSFARYRILLSQYIGTGFSDTIVHYVAPNESTYLWTVPSWNLNTCQVMVQILDNYDNVVSEDASNTAFTIDTDPPSPFSLALPLNNAWANASPRFVWHRATDNFAMSYYQLSISIPDETLRINTSDSANPIPPSGSTWRQATASAGWSSRYYHTSVVFDNKMWVIGGYDGSYRNDVWYSTNGINWICATASAQWSPRCGHTSVVFDNKMWVIGGYDDNNRNDVWYSTDGVTWTCATASAQWPGRFAHTSIVYDNKMWVMGGGNRNDVWYSSDGVNWTCATQSAGWPSRDNHTSLVFDNKMWVMGGSNRDDVWYSSDGINWTCATTSAWYYGGRYGHTSVVFDNKMWVLGGSYPGSDVWYSSDGADWTEATSYAEWTARLNHTSVIFKGMMWVMGGFDRDYNTRRNDVWYSVSPPCLPEGIQTWWVTAFDRAGNSRHSNETFSVRVDTTPPSVPILIAPANGIILTNSSVTFIWHSSSDILSGFHYYRFQVANNINFINPTMTSVIDTFITTTLSDTTYFWRVKAIDSVENESEWSTVGYFRVRTTGIEEKQQQIFDITRLTVKVYPNPAKSFAEIHYTVPVKSRILIQLCDVTGRFIKTLVDNEKRTGIYQVTLNTKELSAGVYFVSLRTDFREQIINRLIILK